MFIPCTLSTYEIQESLGPEKCKPIIKAFQDVEQLIQTNQKTLETDFNSFKKNFEDYKNAEVDRKAEFKKDLLTEIATKADIAVLHERIDALEQTMIGNNNTIRHEMNGKIDSLGKEMNGKIDSLSKEMNGKIDSLGKEMNGKIDSLSKEMRLWMKMLMALALLTIACFSPTAQVLLKNIKF